jgi:phospho-N-acetylmuramoyl-pentapeptide-transferase
MLYYLVERWQHWLAENNLFWAFRILFQTEFRALASALLAFVIVIALGRRTIATLARLKIGDTGATDAELLRQVASSKANVPTMGGILVVGAVLVSSLLLADISEFYVSASLLTMVFLAGVGCADDYLKLRARRQGLKGRQGLYAWEKLAFQLMIGLVVGFFTYREGLAFGPDGQPMPSLAHVLNLPFQKTFMLDDTQSPSALIVNPSLIYLPKWAYMTMAVLLIAGMSNAVNITDGMDGLATGITATVSVGLVLISLIAGRELYAQYLLVPSVTLSGELAVVSGAMLGACLGFLWWNCSPACIFMGDTGALALGGLIGYIALVTRQEFLVLLMSAVFLFELLSVALQVGCFKLTGGKRIFRVAPYHHHLHVGGWTEQQVVARAWIVSVLLVLTALALIKVR